MLTDDNSVKSTLIKGDSEICKAFLFEAAIYFAKEGQQVYYFASKQFESLPPKFHDSREASADALKLMTFIYTPNYEIFVTQLGKLHTFQRPPTVLLIDDFDVFLDYSFIQPIPRIVHVARCCAMLLNTAALCSKVTTQRVQLCAVSFATEHDEILRMYFDNRWSATRETSTGENTNDDRRVWFKEAKNRIAFEYYRLDDAVLVLRRVFGRRLDEENETTENDS